MYLNCKKNEKLCLQFNVNLVGIVNYSEKAAALRLFRMFLC